MFPKEATSFRGLFASPILHASWNGDHGGTSLGLGLETIEESFLFSSLFGIVINYFFYCLRAISILTLSYFYRK